MQMFENQYDLNFKEYLSLKENRENNFCFLNVNDENKLTVHRDPVVFEKDYLKYNISINILKCLNNKTSYREFLVEVNEYVRSQEPLRTVHVKIQRNQIRKKHVTIDLAEIKLDKRESRKKISGEKEISKKKLISEEEALKNAQKLIEEEERQQQKKKNKKDKKKKSGISPIQTVESPLPSSPLPDFFGPESIETSHPENEDLICELEEGPESSPLPEFFGPENYDLIGELEEGPESSPLPDFFGPENDDLIGELEEGPESSPLPDYSSLEVESSPEFFRETPESYPTEEEIFDDLEHSVLDPMIDRLLDQSEESMPKNNTYCLFGSDEHQRRMKEWDLTQIIPEIYCMPKEYLVQMFAQIRMNSSF